MHMTLIILCIYILYTYVYDIHISSSSIFSNIDICFFLSSSLPVQQQSVLMPMSTPMSLGATSTTSPTAIDGYNEKDSFWYDPEFKRVTGNPSNTGNINDNAI